MSIHGDSVGAPSQASPIVVCDVSRAADHQHSEKCDVAVAEVLGKAGRILVVVKRKEPVDQLTEAVFQASSPFCRRPSVSLIEHAVGTGVFQLDRAKCLPLKIADHNIGGEIAENLKFVRQAVRRSNARNVRPEESCQLRTVPEKRQQFTAL